MRILAAILSTLCFLLGLAASVLTFLLIAQSVKQVGGTIPGVPVTDYLAWMLAFCGVALPHWLVFRLLHALDARLDPGRDEVSFEVVERSRGRLPAGRALVSALRSAALALAAPSVAVALLLLGQLPTGLLAPPGESPLGESLLGESMLGYQEAAVGGLQLLWIVLLGYLVQWRYRRTVLHLMDSSSAVGVDERTEMPAGGVRAEKPRIRIVRDTETIRLSSETLRRERQARWYRRLAWLRDTLAPLATLAAMLAAAWSFPADALGAERSDWAAALILGWLLLYGFTRVATALRLTDRTPLRQFRLGAGLLVHALLILCVSPLLVMDELWIRSGHPEQRSKLLAMVATGVRRMLRSPRLVWMTACLVMPLLILGLVAAGSPGEVAGWPLLCFAAGAVAFELTYRGLDYLFGLRKGGGNRLIFLRVFGDRRRGRFLFDAVAPRWKGLGVITCIAAPDVSVHQLGADVGWETLFGRLRQRFLGREVAGIVGRSQQAEERSSVLESHCFADTWRDAVRAMMTQNSIVLMDLRGLGPSNQGCIYELSLLRDSFPIGAVRLLIDEKDDTAFLQATLERLWRNMPSGSPNASNSGIGSDESRRVTIYRMSKSSRTAARHLVALLIEACVAGETYNRKVGQSLLKELVEDLQLLAADAAEQVRTVGGGRTPGKKILRAGYSCDPDFDTPAYLLSWGVATDAQIRSLYAVHAAVQEISLGGGNRTAAAIAEDPAWEELRQAARGSLREFGEPRRKPKPRRD